MSEYHVPVMLNEVLHYLDIKPNGVYIDCTLGGGGHSFEIARLLGGKGRLIGIDRDTEAIEEARKRLSPFSDRVHIFHENYTEIDSIVGNLGIEGADGVLFDLGVSSHQFDEGERGFSYRYDAPLDMRMDRSGKGPTAADLVNTLSREELAEIIREYGEERWADRIASFIVERRRRETIDTTGKLADLIKDAIPAFARRSGPHPARRTFQALRIKVNNELENLREGITKAIDILAPGGRICIISFHSLEDRIVKNELRDNARGCICSKELPVCTCGVVAKLKILTGRPVMASKEESERNPRARSAKLRAAERI